MKMRMSFLKPVVATAALVALLSAPSSAQTEKFTGFAINLNGRTGTAVVDFTIERWSTDAEREKLLSIIVEKKDPTQPLLNALQDMKKVGYIKTQNTLAWDLRYAREFKGEDGGRRIVLATDRPIGFAEARNQPRTIDYPFTIIEIHLNNENKGEGRILAGTKIFVDKNKNIVLENYGQQPVRFNEIHPLK